MTSSRYLRYPHLRGDLLTFIADNDVWLAPADWWPGLAHLRRSGIGRLSEIVAGWQPDRLDQPAGRAGRDLPGRATDEGGSARVTYWSHGSTKLRGWGPDGEILATSSAGQPFRFQTWAYAIPVSDGTAQFAEQRRLPYGPVGDLAIDDGVDRAAQRHRAMSSPRSGSDTGAASRGRLWVAERAPTALRASSAGSWPTLPGSSSARCWSGGRLAFISDHEGIGNIYSCALDGSDLRRHTDHAEFYARNASTDGTRIVYQHAGDLWLLTDLSPASEPVRSRSASARRPAAGLRRLVSADDQLDDFSADETGRASVVEVQGTVHWLTHRDGPARALSVIPGPIARLPRVLGDTGQAIWVVDADGADALEIGRDRWRRRTARPAAAPDRAR